MNLPENIRDLVDRYRKAGPRYTSYPSALYFQEDADLDALLEDTRQAEGPFSLYAHIPFCEKLCWFCGCHTLITRDGTKADRYLDLLEKEIAHFRPNLRNGRPVNQMHFGGGTPNYLSVPQIQRLSRILHNEFTFLPESENGVELAPGHLHEEQIHAFRELGSNRASFGIQDCNPEVQQAINRPQSIETNHQTMEWLRSAGFVSVNVDLMYGLPKQNLDSFAGTIDHAIDLNPDRIALFGYAHVPWMKPAQKMLEKAGLPDGSLRLELFLLGLSKLTASGYRYIGLDHFAKADDELAVAQDRGELYRNFQGYSTRAGHEIIAFGISSISQNHNAYRQNVKTLKAYQDRIEGGLPAVDRGLRLTRDDLMRRAIIQEVMCNLVLSRPSFEATFGSAFTQAWNEALPNLLSMADDGLLHLEDTSLRVSQLGRLFLRNIAMAFDTYRPDRKDAYSKTL